MNITLDSIGKQYSSGWVIRDVYHHFESNSITGIKGKNGSGKSTLLRIISSMLTPTEGAISFTLQGETLELEQIPQKISHVAPSIELIDSLTIAETLQFHFAFREMVSGESVAHLLETVWLTDSKELQISELSSGMKQRLQLALAFFTKSELILLDEPTSNLDEEGIDLYYHLIDNYQLGRTIVIASNEERDFKHCQEILDVNQWK